MRERETVLLARWGDDYDRGMSVGALYDLHANLPALSAVLAELEQLDVDHIVVGGDIAWGPFPRATLERVVALSRATVIRGNADREVAEGSTGSDGWIEDVTRWAAAQLSDSQRAYLAGLQTSAERDIVGLGRVLFCHGSPRSDEESITPATPAARLDEMLRDVDADVVVCGHTHMQFDRFVGSKRVVNAGSVGLPYEDAPGAYWTLLSGDGVTFQRTPYEFEQAASDVGASGCPHGTEFFAREVVQPTRREEAMRAFGARTS